MRTMTWFGIVGYVVLSYFDHINYWIMLGQETMNTKLIDIITYFVNLKLLVTLIHF